MSKKQLKQNVKNFLIYIFAGFFIIFLMSLAFPQDICGSGEVQSSPRIFFTFGVLVLILFYFINRFVKNMWVFLLVVVVFSVLFEYLLIGKVLNITSFQEWETYFGMAIYWVVWFGATRLLYQWLTRVK